MLARLFLVLAVALAGLGAAHAQKATPFDHDSATITLPANFVTAERNDGTLRAIFGPAGDHRLEVAIRDVAGPEGATDAGVQFVRGEAKAKGLRVFEYPQRVVYMQPVTDQVVDGKTMKVAAWFVGFGNHVALLTLMAPELPSVELRQFLAQGLDDAVTTVRRLPPRRPPG